MNIDEMEKTIERLKAINAECDSIYSVVEAFIDKEIVHATDAIIFRDTLVNVLEKAKSSWWVNEGDLTELSDDMLAELGLVRLPKDKDGEIIRPGDKVDLNGDVLEVRGVKTYVGAYAVSHSIIFGEHSQYSIKPNALRHHREPTIKDVLTEFQSKTIDWCFDMSLDNLSDSASEKAALVEEYADKLREVMNA